MKFGEVIFRSPGKIGLVFDSKTHRLVVDIFNAEIRLFQRTTRDGQPFNKLLKRVRIEDIEI